MIYATSIFMRRFRRDEDGSLIIFSLVLFFLMVMLGGFAVDLMRYENARTRLQNTLDRSTLAAAALSQDLDREAVVRDYMKKAGIADQLASVTVTEGQNSTSVTAIGSAETNPFFLHLMGIEDFDAKGRSKAEQGISNIEIVLVLDVSGSMSWDNKIGNLKVAAKDFVNTVLGNDPHNRISISIVPYNAQVNIGADLAGRFALTNLHGVADVNCVELPNAAWDTLAIPLDLPMPMMAYADATNGTVLADAGLSPTDSRATPRYNGSFCKPLAHNQVRLPTNQIATLEGYIEGLEATGNTSITLGMKWGATLIDPQMRPSYTAFAAAGKIPGNLPARPFDYADDNARKIIILMTDGEHVEHSRVVNAFKTGPSGIFLAADGNYSVRHVTGRPAEAGTHEYYVPHLDTWAVEPWGGAVAVQQDWRDIWATLKLSYVAWQFHARALSNNYATQVALYNGQIDAIRKTYSRVNDMNDSLQTSCDQVKDAGVTVYGIAFGAPQNGQQVIAACASDGMYFQPDDDPDGTEIQAAFDAIASNITMLKLTQ